MSRAPDNTLATPRLLLRPVGQADQVALHALWTTAGVRRFLWDDVVIPAEQTAEIIAKSAALFDERRFGVWAAWHRIDAQLIGFGALWFFRDPPELELLYGVDENRWGHGYAPEIAQAVVDYAFQRLNMPSLRASTDVGNTASVRVLEKLGFRFIHRATVGGLDTIFYEKAVGTLFHVAAAGTKKE